MTPDLDYNRGLGRAGVVDRPDSCGIMGSSEGPSGDGGIKRQRYIERYIDGEVAALAVLPAAPTAGRRNLQGAWSPLEIG